MKLDAASLCDRYRPEGWWSTPPLFTPEECDRLGEEFEALSDQTLLPGEAAEGPLAYQPMLFSKSPLLPRAIAAPRRVEIVVQPVGVAREGEPVPAP